MSVEKVREYLKKWKLDDKIIEFDQSSATVELAAEAAGVISARIAKTLSFQNGEQCILIITAGDARIDNKKFKARFGLKAKMLSPECVFEYTGFRIGGVCPFGVKGDRVKVYTDISLQRFDTVFPACGSSNSAIELTCTQLFECAQSLEWIDVCREWQENEMPLGGGQENDK